MNNKELETAIMLGINLKASAIRRLSQKKVNHSLFFAYKNNKLEAVEKLLPYWRQFIFNDGKNLIHLLVDNVTKNEKILTDYIKMNVSINNDDLNYYKDLIKKFDSNLNQTIIKKVMNDWQIFFQYKSVENFNQKLNQKLIYKEKNKLVKV